VRRNEIISLAITLIILAVTLGLLAGYNKIDFGQGLQILITAFLVMITAIYVKRTAEIAKATKEQAEATVKMAKENKEQTEVLKETVSLSIRPYISIRVLEIKRNNANSHESPDELSIEVENTGKGPARNFTLSCKCPYTILEYKDVNISSLEVGEKKTCSLCRKGSFLDQHFEEPNILLIEASYEDELSINRSTTLQIKRDNDNWNPNQITIGRTWKV
jgi:hypothetical protein